MLDEVAPESPRRSPGSAMSSRVGTESPRG
jgi:hypothetical protein